MSAEKGSARNNAAQVPNTQVLQGIRVIELGQLIAGPFAAKTLADFGADVIKVEPPGDGDPLRKWRMLHQGTSVWWEAQSRNKRSVCIDLRGDEGRAVVKKLIAGADVVVENFRAGTLEKWGLGWEALHAEFPRLIMLRVSGYGQTGPKSQLPGFAAIAEAAAGLRYLTAEPGRVPVRAGLSLGDTIAGLHGALGVLLALYQRDARGGVGQMIDVALNEAVLNLTENLLAEYSAFGAVRQPAGGALPGIAPSNAYPCTEGHVLIAGNGDSIFKRLMSAIGREDLGADPELGKNDGRVRRIEEIDAAIGAWTSQRSIDDVLAAMEKADVPAGRVCSVADVAADPQLQARGMLRKTHTVDGLELTVPGIVPVLSAQPGDLRTHAPRLGEHTDQVLEEAGVDAKQRASLRDKGVIG
jgi:formyl-CoA transferase